MDKGDTGGLGYFDNFSSNCLFFLVKFINWANWSFFRTSKQRFVRMTEKSTKDDYDDCNDNFHSNDGNFDHNDDKNYPETYNAMPESKQIF